MSTLDPIESDVYYKRLSGLLLLSGLNRAEIVLFLSSFESWYLFQDYKVYSSLASVAVLTLEEMYCEK